MVILIISTGAVLITCAISVSCLVFHLTKDKRAAFLALGAVCSFLVMLYCLATLIVVGGF